MKQKIKQLFSETGVDKILLRTFPSGFEPSLFYFSGIAPGKIDNNVLFLAPKRKPLLVRTVLDPEIKRKNIRIKTVKKRREMEAILNRELDGKRIGINMSLYPAAMLKRLKKALPGKRFVDVSEQLSKVRAIKEKWEIERIAKAARITERVLGKVPSFFRKGMTERKLALEIEFRLREKSKDNIAFPVIVASGRHSSFPHHFPNDSKITKGPVLIDCGAKFKGYCGDLTRVFSVGKPTRAQRDLYNIVYEAKSLGEALCVEGISAGNVFEQVSSFLKRNAGQELIHGMGHGLGLNVHDSPAGFIPESKEHMLNKMVLTVEPGVYLRGFGVRIEDDVVIGKRKCRKLSSAPKELIPLR